MLGKPDGDNSEFFVFYFSEVHCKFFVFSRLAIVLACTKVLTEMSIVSDVYVDISLAVWQP